jgi:hypothetical protein
LLVKPHVLIVGGFLTLPANYWPMRRRLLRRGAASVAIASIWPVDWALASVLGVGLVMRRTRAAIWRAYHAASDEPLIVIGHSGGGIAARLAMSATSFHGERGGAADAVGCLVTLGTPHGLARLPHRYHHAGHDAAEFLDRASPGAYFAPRTAYLSVGADFSMAPFPGIVGFAARQLFDVVVGTGATTAGDGIVPARAVHLEGAEQLTFTDARHGMIGGSWYGDEPIIDRWWPRAVELWRGAMSARAEHPLTMTGASS